MSALRKHAALGLLTVAAAALFFYGARTGSSQTFYIDERFYDRYALELAQLATGKVPRFGYVHPSGYSLTLAIVYAGYFAWLRLVGSVGSVTDFLVRFATHRAEFLVLARGLSATYLLGAVLATHWVAARMFDRTVALVAAAALALSYPLVFYAHIGANITLLAFITALACCAFWAVRERGSLSAYALAGAAIGAGIATKYYPAVLGLGLLVAHRQRLAGRPLVDELHKLVLAGATALASTLVLFPLPVLATAQWRASLADTLAYYSGGDPLQNGWRLIAGDPLSWHAITAEPISWYANSLRTLGEVALVWLAVGLVFGLWRRRRDALLLAPPVLVLFVWQALRGGLNLGARQLYFGLPALWILAAAAAVALGRRLPLRRAGTALLVCVLLIQPARWALRYIELLGHETTLDRARAWLVDKVPDDALVLIEMWEAPFADHVGWRERAGSRAQLGGEAQDALRAARHAAAPPFEIRELRYTDAAEELRAARALGRPVFVVTANTTYWSPDSLAAWGITDGDKTQARRRYYADLAAATVERARFRGHDLGALGPEVVISEAVVPNPSPSPSPSP